VQEENYHTYFIMIKLLAITINKLNQACMDQHLKTKTRQSPFYTTTTTKEE